MPKKLLLPALFALLLVTSCNKSFNQAVGDPNAAVKTLVFTANSSLPVKIIIYIGRGNLEVENINLYGQITPYTFTSKKIQNGDLITATVTNSNNQQLTASLTIDGVDQPPVGSGTDTNKYYFIAWNIVVK